MKRLNYTITASTLLVSSIGLSFNLDIKPAFAGCNVFGCSESSVAECNPFGCPNAPIGQACTPFGCPDSPQPPPTLSQQPIYPYPVQNSSPQAVADCMENLMYRTVVQKPFPGWICVANDVNCKTVRVRTEVSDSSAAVACQNAR